MRLAEALLRVPDAETAVALTADQLGRADFDGAADDGPHKMLANLSASAIALSKRFLPDSVQPPGLLQRLGARTVVAATVRAIQLLGRQFVLGRTIQEAMDEAAGQRRAQAGLRFSYDMLGEGARTERDAERYLASYAGAIAAIAGGAHCRLPHGCRRHLHQAQRAVLALRGRAARPGLRRTAAARVEPDRARGAGRHQPHHRRRRKRPPGAEPGRAGRAGRARGRRLPRLAGPGPGGAGLPDAFARGGRCGGRDRAPPRPEVHGAAGEGRLLGRRDQARAGSRAARLPGVHAQAPHRHRATWPAPAR